MTNCEMCGAEGRSYLVQVEGVELNVCKKCTSFGKAVKRPRAAARKKAEKAVPKPQRKQKEIIQVITENFSRLIREKREKLGLKQKEFAKFLSERESVIHKMESGSYIPSLNLARKIEKQLGISLIEQKEIEPQNVKAKSASFTIGDVVKVR